MRIWIAALAAGVLAASFDAAEAHPKLLSTNPAANARVRGPAEVRLAFSETLIQRFSHLALVGPSGQAVRLGEVAASPDKKQLAAAVQQKLGPGRYTVTWSATSTDTHRVKGAYGFTVTP